MQSQPDKNIGSAKISKFAYLFEFVFLYEPLRMKIDHLHTTLGVVNDVESHYNVKYIIVPANFANVIMPRRHAQISVIDNCLFHGFLKFLRQIVSLDGIS